MNTKARDLETYMLVLKFFPQKLAMTRKTSWLSAGFKRHLIKINGHLHPQLPNKSNLSMKFSSLHLPSIKESMDQQTNHTSRNTGSQLFKTHLLQTVQQAQITEEMKEDLHKERMQEDLSVRVTPSSNITNIKGFNQMPCLVFNYSPSRKEDKTDKTNELAMTITIITEIFCDIYDRAMFN